MATASCNGRWTTVGFRNKASDLKSQWIELHYGARNRKFDPAAANLTGTA